MIRVWPGILSGFLKNAHRTASLQAKDQSRKCIKAVFLMSAARESSQPVLTASITLIAARIPSRAELTIPPAYPLPSPQG